MDEQMVSGGPGWRQHDAPQTISGDMYARRKKPQLVSASDGPILSRMIADSTRGDSGSGAGLPYSHQEPRRGQRQ
jgi:hypothetical protein